MTQPIAGRRLRSIAGVAAALALVCVLSAVPGGPVEPAKLSDAAEAASIGSGVPTHARSPQALDAAAGAIANGQSEAGSDEDKKRADLAALITSTLSSAARRAPDLDPQICDDFYEAACGGWFPRAKLPKDTDAFTLHDDTVAQSVARISLAIAEEGGDPVIAPYFAACTDHAGVEAAGAGPLRGMVHFILLSETLPAAFEAVGRLQSYGIPAVWGSKVQFDGKMRGVYALVLSEGEPSFADNGIMFTGSGPGGLSLDDPSEYNNQESVLELLESIENAFRMIKEELWPLPARLPPPAVVAPTILEFERGIAKCFAPDTSGDPASIDNYFEMGALKAQYPSIDWDRYITGLGRDGVPGIVLEQPDFFKCIANMLSPGEEKEDEKALDHLRHYLLWQLLRAASDLNVVPGSDNKPLAAMAARRQKLKGRAHSIQPQGAHARDLWCTDIMQSEIGMAIAKQFVKESLPPRTQDQTTKLAQSVIAEFSAHLDALPWMDEDARKAARGKAEAAAMEMAYPYDRTAWGPPLELISDDLRPDGRHFFTNVIHVRRLQRQWYLGLVGSKGKTGDIWPLTPLEVNAEYHPEENALFVYAAQMLAPDYDVSYPDSYNYGSFGTICGHELLHGFDDEGSHFQADGRLADLFSPPVMKAYQDASQCVVDLYSKQELRPGSGLFVDGKLTLAENIADIGGVKIAYWAAERKAGGPDAMKKPSLIVPALTEAQMFFVAYAQSYCAIEKPSAARLALLQDDHSPPRFRVNLPLANFPAFAEAFGCAAGTRMRPAPADTCRIWW